MFFILIMPTRDLCQHFHFILLVWGGMTVIVAIKGAIGGNANTPKNVSYLECLRNECEIVLKNSSFFGALARVHYILHRFILD